METSELPISGILTDIKQHLDPAYTYLFMEKADQNESVTAFSSALGSLKDSPVEGICWQLYRDAAAGLTFLMVKVPPDYEERFIQYILTRSLERDLKLSWYKNRARR